MRFTRLVPLAISLLCLICREVSAGTVGCGHAGRTWPCAQAIEANEANGIPEETMQGVVDDIRAATNVLDAQGSLLSQVLKMWTRFLKPLLIIAPVAVPAV
jgi:hypothetical protein